MASGFFITSILPAPGPDTKMDDLPSLAVRPNVFAYHSETFCPAPFSMYTPTCSTPRNSGVPLASLIHERTCSTFCVIASKSPAFTRSLTINLDPIPRQAAPALIHSNTLSCVALTPPVGMSLTQGQGPSMLFMKPGFSLLPGNTFTMSHPISSAWEISDGLAHPGEYGTLRRLQTLAISGLKTGPTTKLAPLLM